jgi:hypothetical protein
MEYFTIGVDIAPELLQEDLFVVGNTIGTCARNSNMRSTVPTTFAIATLLHFHAFGQDCPSNLINHSYRNSWKVESLIFTRRGNDSGPPELVDAGFQLYHPKYDRTEVCANRTWPSLDSELCLDANGWNKPVHCNTFNTNAKNEKLPTPDTLWRPCTGRITFGPSFVDEARCKNVTLLDALSGKAGTCYEGYVNVEDKSDQPWTKWRVLNLDEPPYPTRNDTMYSTPTKPFRSITLEVVNAQR